MVRGNCWLNTFKVSWRSCNKDLKNLTGAIFLHACKWGLHKFSVVHNPRTLIPLHAIGPIGEQECAMNRSPSTARLHHHSMGSALLYTGISSVVQSRKLYRCDSSPLAACKRLGTEPASQISSSSCDCSHQLLSARGSWNGLSDLLRLLISGLRFLCAEFNQFSGT